MDISMLYRHIIAPLLFSLTRRDPEIAHTATIAMLSQMSNVPALLSLMRAIWTRETPSLHRTVCGIRFPNPVGLAAGYDKDGTALPALAASGFGFIEIGTVTWYAQPGNPRPRIFRMPAIGGLVNRMGFNNNGAEAMATNVQKMLPVPVPVAISLGKSRRTPLEEAVDDYCSSLRVLYPAGDFFTVNVSSPNTPGLRTLQDKAQLEHLLAALHTERRNLSQGSVPKPLFVKIAPDLSDHAIADVLTVCAAHAVNGIIATNTTRVGKDTPRSFCETGGLSGRPLAERACEVVRFISRETGGTLPIIGVGGIMSPNDAHRMFDAGARLIQLYTGLIYEGPGLIRAITRSLVF